MMLIIKSNDMVIQCNPPNKFESVQQPIAVASGRCSHAPKQEEEEYKANCYSKFMVYWFEFDWDFELLKV